MGGLWLGTFHALCARMLRLWGEAVGLRRDFVIYDDDDQKRLMTRVLADLQVPERLFPVRQVLGSIDRAKNQGLDPGQLRARRLFRRRDRASAYTAYEERLQAANAVDFGGLLVQALRLTQSGGPAAAELAERFLHVLVDEFQDTNSVQYRLVRFLSHKGQSITVVGDEDQSIYKWRGADIRNILDFERDHPGAVVVKLEQNYRSTGNILRVANAVIARNTERREKRLFTSLSTGDPIVSFEGETERDEAEFVAATIGSALGQDAAPRDFAVFYRTNAQSRVIEEALRARDIPYTVVGGVRFYDRAEIKDLVAYLRVLQNLDDEMALLRIVNTPTRGIGDTTVEKVVAFARQQKQPVLAAMRVAADNPGQVGLGGGPARKLGAFLALHGWTAGGGPVAGAGGAGRAGAGRQRLPGRADRRRPAWRRRAGWRTCSSSWRQMRDYEKESDEPTLAGFLERVALVSDVDGYDPDKGAVSLMTVHTAKGLEFRWVFVTGLEERVFPHARSVDDEVAVEEERRLCYVAVTRAMRRLFLTRVRRRRLSGQELPGIPSRFLQDLPTEAIDTIAQPRPAYMTMETEGAGPWAGRWSRDVYLPDRANPIGAVRAGPRRRPTPAAPPARGGGIRVEYDEAPPADEDSPFHPKPADRLGDPGLGGLRIGGRLRHVQFGVGEIRGWQPSSDGVKVTLRFDKVGIKTVLARFLTRV